MNLTQSPLRFYPHTCVVTGREDGEMIDFEAERDYVASPHIYIKREVVEEAATKLCGMVPASEVEELRAQLQELGVALDDARDTMNMAAELEEKVRSTTPERTAA